MPHLYTVMAGAAALAWLLTAGQSEAQKPSIVIMTATGVGYGDPGVYGGGELRGAPTPRLDALAAQGLRLTNFNVEVEAAQTRAALLTGRLPIRSGLGVAGPPGGLRGLQPWEVTLAELLAQAGYATASYGSWPLGDSPGRGPTDQGFDEWFGFVGPASAVFYTTDPAFDRDVAPVPFAARSKKGDSPQDVMVYDLKVRRSFDRMLVDRGVEFIKRHAASGPFFLYVPFAFAQPPALAHPQFQGKSATGEFADSLLEHDANVGQILAALKAGGVEDSTLVIWMSDGGPVPLAATTPAWTGGDSGPWRGEGGTALEGALRVPCIVRWPGKVPAGRVTNQIVAALDLFPTLAGAAGGTVPADRPLDGVDQRDLFQGKRETSARDHVLTFAAGRLAAVKWRQFKLHVPGRTGADAAAETWPVPTAYNLAADPKERRNIAWQSTWVFQGVLRYVTEYVASVRKAPNVKPGAPDHAPPRSGEDGSAALTGAEDALALLIRAASD